jgi:hypothetical protein
LEMNPSLRVEAVKEFDIEYKFKSLVITFN